MAVLNPAGKRENGDKVLTGFIKVVLLFFCLVGVAEEAHGQNINLDASFSRDTILIGDQVEFAFSVDQPEGMKVNLPDFNDTLPGGIEILKKLGIDTVSQPGNRLTITQKYLVTSFDTSEVVVPPISVDYDTDSLHVRLGTPPKSLYVKAMPVDTSKSIVDIKMPYKAPVTFAELLPYILVFLLLALVAFFLYRYFRHRKKPDHPAHEITKPAEPAHVIALRELNRLRDEKYWQQGKIKPYYTRLTDILRTYLGHRYGINAMEMTTFESLQALQKQGFNDNKMYRILKDILSTADLVKFAKYTPLPEKNESVMLDAVVFVNGTREAWNKEETEERTDGKAPEDTATAPPPAKEMIKEEETHD